MLIEIGSHPEKNPTQIHRINVITGEFLKSYNLSAKHAVYEIEALIALIDKERPERVIFRRDETHKEEYYSYFMKTSKAKGLFEVDSSGLVTYFEEVK